MERRTVSHGKDSVAEILDDSSDLRIRHLGVLGIETADWSTQAKNLASQSDLADCLKAVESRLEGVHKHGRSLNNFQVAEGNHPLLLYHGITLSDWSAAICILC